MTREFVQFVRFRIGNFYNKNAKHSGRSSTVDSDKSMTLADANSHSAFEEIQDVVGVSDGSVISNFKHSVHISRWMCGVLHDLSEKNLSQCFVAYDLLFEKNREHRGSVLRRKKNE